MMKNCKNLLCDVNASCLMIVDIQEKLSAVMPEKVINRLKSKTANEVPNIARIITAIIPS